MKKLVHIIFLQMDRNAIKTHLAAPANHDANGNSWCHVDSCGGSYAAYRINIWGLKSPEENRKKNRNMIAQQVANIENHLAKAHGTFV